MKKLLNRIVVFDGLAGLISFCFIAYNFSIFFYIRQHMISNDLDFNTADSLVIGTALSLILLLIFHLTSIVVLFLDFNYFKKTNLLKSFTFFIGVVSMILILSNVALLSDIGKEYKHGLEVEGEWRVLFAVQAIHAFFHLLMFINLFNIRGLLRKQVSVNKVLKDEVIFITAQYTGVFCGILGIMNVILLSFSGIKLIYLKSTIIVFSLILFAPYCFIALYWFVLKSREKITEWFDEKQFKDILKASVISMLLSVLIMGAYYIAQFISYRELMRYTWYPVYLFLVLFLLSSSTLFFSQKE